MAEFREQSWAYKTAYLVLVVGCVLLFIFIRNQITREADDSNYYAWMAVAAGIAIVGIIGMLVNRAKKS